MSRLVGGALLLAAALLVCSAAAVGAAQDEAGRPAEQQPELPRFLELSQVEVTGKVSYSDGQVLTAGAPVRVWSTQEARFVHETKTSEGGVYRLPALEPGDYQIVFADRVRVPAVVTETQGEKPFVFDVMIPRGTAAFARMPIEEKALVLSVLAGPSAEAGPGVQGTDPEDEDNVVVYGLLPAIIGIGAASCCAKLCITQDWCDLRRDDRRDPVSP